MFFYHKSSFIQEEHIISCRDRSFLFGDGFFTTFKLEQGKVLFLDKHLERLQQSAKKLLIPWAISLEELESLLFELYQLNQNVANTFRVRVMISRGEGIWSETENAKPELFIFFNPWEKTFATKTLMFSENKIDDESLLTRYKTTSRLTYVQALNEAQQSGADDALLLNLNNQLVCTTCANVWVIDENDRLLTPMNGLKGITQMALMDCFSGNAFLQVITPEMLYHAKLIFLSNSLIGVQKAQLINQEAKDNQRLFNALEKKFTQYCRQFEKNLV